jgi:hypothetical protein
MKKNPIFSVNIKLIYLKLLKKSHFLVLVLIFLSSIAQSQDDKVKVGYKPQQFSQTGGFFDYSDPDKVNIEVNVWGYVRYPGKYMIVRGKTMLDVLSYAGGPVTDAQTEKLRLFRPKNDSLNIPKDQILYFDYNDLLWGKEVKDISQRNNTVMLPGDVLIVPGYQRLFFRDDLLLVLAITSTLVSLGILAVSIVNTSK